MSPDPEEVFSDEEVVRINECGKELMEVLERHMGHTSSSLAEMGKTAALLVVSIFETVYRSNRELAIQWFISFGADLQQEILGILEPRNGRVGDN